MMTLPFTQNCCLSTLLKYFIDFPNQNSWLRQDGSQRSDLKIRNWEYWSCGDGNEINECMNVRLQLKKTQRITIIYLVANIHAGYLKSATRKKRILGGARDSGVMVAGQAGSVG